ncbi:MAG: PIN domain-containing protein [Acidobacteriota bacterium]
MKLLVDTSVWSLALRRDEPSTHATVTFLTQALWHGDSVFTTGLILQELLQGFHGPKTRDEILKRFDALPLIIPQQEDHIAAADLRNECRRRGVQVDTIDALLAQLCIRHQLTMLTTDEDFVSVARYAPLNLWRAPTPNTPP